MSFPTRYRLITVFCLGVFSVAFTGQLPTVFLIGDSISIQYGPYLKTYLEGVATLDRKKDDGSAEKNLDVPKGANGGDSRMVLEYLKSKLKDPTFQPNYLLLNCGLHDIKRNSTTGEIQVDEKNYRKNLTTIFNILKERNIQPIWIRTTAVVDTIHNSRSKAFKRYSRDLTTYNAIADEICHQFQIPVIDLHGFSWRLGLEQFADHVHYKEAARALQGAYIAGHLTQLITQNSKN